MINGRDGSERAIVTVRVSTPFSYFHNADLQKTPSTSGQVFVRFRFCTHIDSFLQRERERGKDGFSSGYEENPTYQVSSKTSQNLWFVTLSLTFSFESYNL